MKKKIISPLFGFIPGDEKVMCVSCYNSFRGSIKARQCEKCALEIVEEMNKKNFIDDFIESFGENGVYSKRSWKVTEFLDWLKINNFKISKDYNNKIIKSEKDD